jgi:hypothetical protein
VNIAITGQKANKRKTLDPGEDRTLTKAAKDGDFDAEARVIEAYIDWGTWYGRTINPGMPIDDLRQEVAKLRTKPSTPSTCARTVASPLTSVGR